MRGGGARGGARHLQQQLDDLHVTVTRGDVKCCALAVAAAAAAAVRVHITHSTTSTNTAAPPSAPDRIAALARIFPPFIQQHAHCGQTAHAAQNLKKNTRHFQQKRANGDTAGGGHLQHS